MNNKTIAVVAGSLLFLALFTHVHAAYGQIPLNPYEQLQQQQPQPQPQQQAAVPSGVQQIIDAAKAECATQVRVPENPEITDVLAESCVSLVHGTPTMVVLTGDLLILTGAGLYSDNTLIWKAIDDSSKNMGLTIEEEQKEEIPTTLDGYFLY